MEICSVSVRKNRWAGKTELLDFTVWLSVNVLLHILRFALGHLIKVKTESKLFFTKLNSRLFAFITLAMRI